MNANAKNVTDYAELGAFKHIREPTFSALVWATDTRQIHIRADVNSDLAVGWPVELWQPPSR